MKKNKKLVTALCVVLASILAIAGTFAWFVTTDRIDNPFKTASAIDDVEIQEIFDPVEEWLPGQTMTKEVSVVNTGSGTALVRVHFEELLSLAMAPVGVADPFDGASGADVTPYLFNAASYTETNGWYEVTTTENANLGDLKLAASYDDLKIYAKMSTSGSIDTYAFVVTAPITATSTDFDGKVQAVNAVAEINKATRVLTVSDVEYLQIPGRDDFAANWTVDTALVAFSGLNAGALTEKKADTDLAASYDNNIILNFANALSTTVTAGNWVFNPDDGYFYYLGRLDSGNVTPNLLNSVTLSSDAGSQYGDLNFNLIVEMKAIQNTVAAMEAEFGLTSTSTGTSAAIYALLASYCAS